MNTVIKPGSYRICSVFKVSPRADYVLGKWICDPAFTVMFHITGGRAIVVDKYGNPVLSGAITGLPKEGEFVVGHEVDGQGGKYSASQWGLHDEFVKVLAGNGTPLEVAAVVPAQTTESPAGKVETSAKKTEVLVETDQGPSQLDKFRNRDRRRKQVRQAQQDKFIEFPRTDERAPAELEDQVQTAS